MNETTCADLGHPELDRNLDIFLADSPVRVIVVTVFICITVFTVAANSVIILAMIRFSCACHANNTVSSWTHSRALMMSMAVSDLFLGIFIMPLGVYELLLNGYWYLPQELCGITSLLDVILSIVSIFHVVCMAIDRYLAVCWPFVHLGLTMRVTYVMISICWLVPLSALWFVYLMKWEKVGVESLQVCIELKHVCQFVTNSLFDYISAPLTLYAPFTIIFVLYYLILREVCRVHSRNRRRLGHFRETAASLPAGSRVSENGGQNDAIHEQNNVSSSNDTSDGKASCYNTKSDRCEAGEESVLTISEIVAMPKTSTDAQGSEVSNRRNELSELTVKVIPTTAATTATTSSLTTSLSQTNLQQSASGESAATTSTTTWDAGRLGFPVLKFVRSFLRRTPVYKIETSYGGSRNQQVLTQDHCQTVEGHGKAKSKKKSMKAIQTLGRVVIIFTICWLPFSIVIALEKFLAVSLPSWATIGVVWLGYANSAFNPIVYCSNRAIRRAVLTLLCPRQHRELR